MKRIMTYQHGINQVYWCRGCMEWHRHRNKNGPADATARQRRQQIGSRLREAASASGLRSYAAEGVFHHFVVLSEQRNELREFLSAHGVSTAIHYPAAVGDMPGLGSLPSTPVASAHSRMTLSLPCFPEMTQAEVDHVESALRAWGAAHD